MNKVTKTSVCMAYSTTKNNPLYIFSILYATDVHKILREWFHDRL